MYPPPAPAGLRRREQQVSIEVRLDERRVLLDGHEVRLMRMQWRLLEVFYSRPGKLITREEVLFKVWGHDDGLLDHRLLNVWVHRLRQSLPGLPLVTVWGEGYRLDLPTGVVPQ